MALQPTNPPREIVWLPDGCPDWCADGNLHAEYEDYVDRIHSSGVVAIIPLLADEERPLHTENPELQINLQQHYREIAPRVCISRNGTRGIFLTLDETASLAHELLKVAATARGEIEQEARA